MHGYKAFYKGKVAIEVYADTSYQAQCQAAIVWNLKPSQRMNVTVVLCELNGKQVTHIATE